jgi:hypothetical protein
MSKYEYSNSSCTIADGAWSWATCSRRVFASAPSYLALSDCEQPCCRQSSRKHEVVKPSKKRNTDITQMHGSLAAWCICYFATCAAQLAQAGVSCSCTAAVPQPAQPILDIPDIRVATAKKRFEWMMRTQHRERGGEKGDKGQPGSQGASRSWSARHGAQGQSPRKPSAQNLDGRLNIQAQVDYNSHATKLCGGSMERNRARGIGPSGGAKAVTTPRRRAQHGHSCCAQRCPCLLRAARTLSESAGIARRQSRT